MITDNEPPALPEVLRIDLAELRKTLPRNIDTPPRGQEPFDWAAFMERTRRYHRLTHNPPTNTRYARGLDSKQEEMA